MASKDVSQHKRLAMGHDTGHTSRTKKFAVGGSTNALKTGTGDNPLTESRRANGVPGLKKGGAAK